MIRTDVVISDHICLFRFFRHNKWSVHDLGTSISGRIVRRLNAKAFQARATPMQLGTTMATTSRCLWKVSWRGTRLPSHLILICMSESGNMVIMALSYAQKTGDNSQLAQYVCALSRVYIHAI